jgi:DNA modification methylase
MTSIFESGLKPDTQNANEGTQRGLGLLDKSIRKLGAGRSILADKNGNIIAGNKTLDRAADIDMPVRIVHTNGDELVVVQRDDLDLYSETDKRARQLAYADNKIAEVDLAWKPDQITVDFEPLELKEWGFDDPNPPVADAEPQIDRAAELNEKWKVATGDLWKIGEHRLLCGDSTIENDVKAVMRDDMIELVWTDPPYGVSIGDKNKYLNSIAPSNRVEENLENDTLDDAGLVEMLCNSFDNTIAHCTAGAGWYVAAPPGPPHVLFGQVLKERGIWRQTIQWVKNNSTFSPMGVCYHWQAEPIFFGWLPDGGHRYYGGRKQTTVWEIDRPSKNPEHPTMKPIELVQRAVENSSLENEIVADFFCGSGTTMVACENLSRKCRAIEISPNYCAVILERMATAFPELTIERMLD